jgi:hypothetical protein
MLTPSIPTPLKTTPETPNPHPTSTPSIPTTPSESYRTFSNNEIPKNVPSDSLTLILEMNRQFANLDTKMMVAESNSNIKVESLVTEVRSLKQWLGATVGALSVVLLRVALKGVLKL